MRWERSESDSADLLPRPKSRERKWRGRNEDDCNICNHSGNTIKRRFARFHTRRLPPPSNGDVSRLLLSAWRDSLIHARARESNI